MTRWSRTQCSEHTAHPAHFIIFTSPFYVSFTGGVIVPSCVQTIEHVGQNWRELCVCICAWAMGIPILLLEGLITRHWRWLGIATSSTSLLSIGIYLWVLQLVYEEVIIRMIDITRNRQLAAAPRVQGYVGMRNCNVLNVSDGDRSCSSQSCCLSENIVKEKENKLTLSGLV
jgi:hypothetical protein